MIDDTFNNNIRCIEMRSVADLQKAGLKFNNNIRCIEMMLPIRFIRLICCLITT